MKRTMLLCVALAGLAAIHASAVDLPVREPVGITNTAPATLSLPAFGGNGQLLAVQIVDDGLTNNTCAITHAIPVGNGREVTNTVATLTYTTTHGASTNLPAPPYGFAGERYAAKFGNSSTGVVIFTRSIVK